MSFLTEIATRGLNTTSQPLTNSALLDVLGGVPSETGVDVSAGSSMRIGAVLRGVQILAGTVGSLPLKAYRPNVREEYTPWQSIIRGGRLTPFEVMEATVTHMILFGNAYLYKRRNGRGGVSGLEPIHPSRVSIQVDNPQSLDWQKVFLIDGKPFTNYEIIHIPMLSLDGVRGLGPIAYARETVGIAAANESAAAKLFGQGMLQSGVVSTEQPLDEEKANRLKARWRQKMSGLANAQDVAILDNGAKFYPLTLNPEDAQFLESRKFQVTEIARLLGIPGWMLNDQEKSTSWGTGMEQQFTTWVKITLNAVYLSRIEQCITRSIFNTNSAYVEFNIDGLLRGDSKARAAFYNAGITGGWLVPNDVRPKENLPPVPWGDEPYLPNNQSAESQRDDLGAEDDDGA